MRRWTSSAAVRTPGSRASGSARARPSVSRTWRTVSFGGGVQLRSVRGHRHRWTAAAGREFEDLRRLRRQGGRGAGRRLVRRDDQEGRSQPLHPPRRRRRSAPRAGHRPRRPGRSRAPTARAPRSPPRSGSCAPSSSRRPSSASTTPSPARYKFDLLPGSPAIAKVSESDDPPPARVSARVTGRGAKRTLVYDVLRRPDQRVTFVEVGPAGSARSARSPAAAERSGSHPPPGPAGGRSKPSSSCSRSAPRRRPSRRSRHPPRRLGRPARVTVRRRANRLLVRLDASPRSRTLRGRDHAHQRRAAHHAHAPRVRHDQPRGPRRAAAR